MNILVVDGWTEEGNADHVRAGCQLQCHIFRDLIKKTLPKATITIINTHRDSQPIDIQDAPLDAVVWTGSGCNIYDEAAHNRRQLLLCERLLANAPHVWGSCWGLQVIVTVLGGKIARAEKPEIGIAGDIRWQPNGFGKVLYREKPETFDAPTHHFDEVRALPKVFNIIAENNVTLQAIVSADERIVCTQYHPELPYDYIATLMDYWAENYCTLLDEAEFKSLLGTLRRKEETKANFEKSSLKTG